MLGALPGAHQLVGNHSYQSEEARGQVLLTEKSSIFDVQVYCAVTWQLTHPLIGTVLKEKVSNLVQTLDQQQLTPTLGREPAPQPT